MLVFPSFFRLWLWLRFLPLIAASLIQGADRAVQAVAYPFLFNWGFLAIAAYQLYGMGGRFRPLAWLATGLALVHWPYTLLVLALLREAPQALRVLAVDLPALLLLVALYRTEGRGKSPRGP